jgi:transposase
MTLLPPGVKVHLAFGYIDMRKGINGLAMLVQGVLRQDPFSGHLFVFRGVDDVCIAASWPHTRDQGCGNDLQAGRQWTCWGQLSFRPGL